MLESSSVINIINNLDPVVPARMICEGRETTMTILKERRIALGVILCAAIAVMANAYPGRSSSTWNGMAGSQNVGSLERRISSLEQRLYSIGTSINRLEQSALSPRTPALQP